MSSATHIFSEKVRYWQVHLNLTQEPDIAMLQALLPQEQQEMLRFRQREDRVRFAGVRAALRKILGTVYHVDPMALIQRDHFGKPELVTPLGASLAFNVSHSGACGLIAVSQSGQVGVDIEKLSPINVAGLAPLICTPSECARLAALSAAAAQDAFYRLWVGKEAALKAVGVGIGGDHMRTIALQDDGRVCTPDAAPPFDPALISVQPIVTTDGYCAAVALYFAP
ncbi:4'-phosphopantetheinyl transferase superfamily protein [Glaciimonas sp. CA11.2]|uniref:4'-phosphopantetheinyl transferase family protein n=2 Tax=Glaciimonas TaxID=1229970 RepID=UPI002B2247CA|nr:MULTISPECIES: 4'-phosphopantetheinyl transferase superfamily protein [unclassified Glaciimonas]MEB0162772.1 4'-phosphopantetheinyl transferase superfamily protein [Glaciimonas sp. CA11.2]